MKENLKSKGQVSLNGLPVSPLPARRFGELKGRSRPRTLGTAQLRWLPQGWCAEGGDGFDDRRPGTAGENSSWRGLLTHVRGQDFQSTLRLGLQRALFLWLLWVGKQVPERCSDRSEVTQLRNSRYVLRL